MQNSEILNRLITNSGIPVCEIAEESGYEASRISACRYGTNNHNPSTFMIDVIRASISKIGKKNTKVWNDAKVLKLMDMLNKGVSQVECGKHFDCSPFKIQTLIKTHFRYELREE